MFQKFRQPITAPGLEQYRVTRLTETNVKALLATPITLVPDPPTGYHLIFCGATIYKPANTDAYDAPGAGDDLAIKYTDVNGLQVGSCETTGVLNVTTTQTRWVHPYTAASGASDITPVTAKKLVLVILNANVVNGNGLLRVKTFYKTLPDAF